MKITKHILKDLKLKFNLINPYIRRKRGLINSLGSFIKAITGNLDNEDAQNFNEEIEIVIENMNDAAIKILELT